MALHLKIEWLPSPLFQAIWILLSGSQYYPIPLYGPVVPCEYALQPPRYWSWVSDVYWILTLAIFLFLLRMSPHTLHTWSYTLVPLHSLYREGPWAWPAVIIMCSSAWSMLGCCVFQTPVWFAQRIPWCMRWPLEFSCFSLYLMFLSLFLVFSLPLHCCCHLWNHAESNLDTHCTLPCHHRHAQRPQ